MGRPNNLLLLLAFTLAACWRVVGGDPIAAVAQGGGWTNSYFGSRPLYRIDLTIPPAGERSLRAKPREYVKAIVRSEGNVFADVGLHLKGSTGSFRPFDDKPGFTLDFTRYRTDQTFEHQTKIHLNNSVEDPSYLSEQVGSDFFRSAGLPVPAVAHALVTLNGRALGLYVLVEGLTPVFLRQHYTRADGPIFEKDVEIGAPPPDARLQTLVGAVGELDPGLRWNHLGDALDRAQLIDYLAWETVLVHRDGYGVARNNFRFYLLPDTGRVAFLPHGMDQLFGPPNFPVEPQMAGTVARAILSTAEGLTLYRRRLRLAATALTAGTNRVHELAEQLRPFLSGSLWREVSTGAEDLGSRLAARARWLQTELARSLQVPLDLSGGPLELGERMIPDTSGGGSAMVTHIPPNTSALELASSTASAPAWSAQVFLSPGRYRIVAKVRVDSLKPLPFGKHSGVVLRTFGAPFESNWLSAPTDGESLTLGFEVRGEAKDVRILLELRASSGKVLIDRNSLQLTQIQ